MKMNTKTVMFCTLVFFALFAMTIGTTTVLAEDPAPNPELSSSCGIDMVLILDVSGSIDTSEFADMADAFEYFVDAFLPTTPTRMAVVHFDTYAELKQSYTNNISDIKYAINARTNYGSTNWYDALLVSYNEFVSNSRADKPDLFVFASDGNWNYGGDPVPMANTIKNAGVRIETLGIGTGVNSANLISISSEDAYHATDFDTLADDLANLSQALCGGTISVQKFVDGVPAAGWNFSADVTGGTADPSYGLTDSLGFVLFEINISEGYDVAYVDITETLQEGYQFDNVTAFNCSGDEVGTPGINEITCIPVTKDCAIYCVFNNSNVTETDMIPPITNKTVGDPKYGPNDEWVTSDTWFNLTATDDESGVYATYFRIWYNDSGDWVDVSGVQEYDGNFTIGDYHEYECEHRIEYWSVDNAGNEECHHNQTHYVDNSEPYQTYEFGDPKNETNTPGFVGIGPITPVWLNSTDLGGCAVGSKYLAYELWYGDELIEKTVYDGDPINDTNPEFGKISVLLDEWETCAHQIHFWCADYLGNGGGFTAFDFWVDAEGPSTASEFSQPYVVEETGFIWDWTWVNYTTIKFINATDVGCYEIEGACAGVQRIEWAVHLDSDCDGIYEHEFWRQGVVYDNDENDTNDEVGVISMEISLYEDCCHLIVHTAYDYFGNEQPFDAFEMKQHVKVDGTEPTIYKTVGDPNCTGCSECGEGDYCVRTNTPISFYAEDFGCLWEYPEEHEGVGLDYVRYRIHNGTAWGSWIYDEELDGETFTFEDECKHYLEIEAVDLLGNLAYDNETFYVDDTPPFIDKDVGTPNVPDELPDYWINCNTVITIDAWDEGCCNNLTYVGYNINGTGWVEITTMLPKTLTLPSCVHTLDIKAVDCLGNTRYDNETFYVDCDEPDIFKTVGDPNCTGCPDCGQGDYCVKTDTLISFYAEDKGCMGGVGLDEVKYRIWGPEYGYDWIDATTLGVRDDYLSTGNDVYALYDLDFTFNFYGNSYTQVYIGTNGYLTFDGGYTTWSHDGILPSAYNPLNMIAPAFYDICPAQGGDVYIYKDLTSSPKKLVVEWYQCELWNTGGSHTLEVIIYETGEIKYQYGPSSNSWGQDYWGLYPLVGIQNEDATVGVQYDMPLYDGLALEFSSSGNSYVVNSGWGPWIYDYDLDGETFTFEEECMHYLQIVATDKLGNVEVDNETFYVDDTPPKIDKVVGEPNELGDGEVIEYWVSCNTPITIDAEDLGCCGYLTNVSYSINCGPWINITGSLPFTFSFIEDCYHTLDIYAEDCLGNSATDFERFYVDCQPPIVEKEVGAPKCTYGLPDGDYYVTRDTRIWINATENYTFDPCAIDEIHMLLGVYYDGVWRYTWYNETGDDGWIRVSFTFDELGVGDDCVHYVTYYVVDKLGNYVEDNETFYVDNTPPETEKSFEGPTYGEDDYWLRDNDTWVILNTTDLEEPCDSGARYLHVELWWASNGDDIDTLLWARDVYDGDEVNDTDEDYGEIQYKFQIYEDCLHEIRWYAVDCLGNVEECSEQQVNLFFDDFENNLDKWVYSRVTRKNNFYSHDGYYAELEAIDDWRNAWMLTSVNTMGYDDVYLSYWARTRCADWNDYLRVKWRVGTSGDWIQVNAIQDNDWEYYTHELVGAGNQPVVQILFKMDCFWDYGLVDDVLVTGDTTMCTQQHRVDSTPPELIKTVGEPSFTDDEEIWWVTTDTEITLDAVDHLEPCAVGVDTLQYRIWWRDRWSEWIDYEGPFSFEEGCTHYLEVNVTDYLGNNVMDNETFIVHGSSGDDDPDVIIKYPTFIPVMTISDETLAVVIYAHDEFTTWENLDVYLRVPGGRQNAPDLWYDVFPLDEDNETFVAYVDVYYYKDKAQITLEAYAVDEDGNVGFALPVTFKVHSTTVWDTWMEKGWNLITLLPNTGCNESVQRIIASVSDSYDLIFHHVPLNGWLRYLKGAISNSLTMMEGGKQYWVHITEEDGVRYYLAHPDVGIQYPVYDVYKEDIAEINGYAWDSQDGVTSVDLQLYYENDSMVKYYWNGSGWTPAMTDLPCVLGGGYNQSWYYDTTGVEWLDYTKYFATAIAYDSFGCAAYDTMNFSINFTKYMLSGTIFNDTDVTLESGDWLWVAVFDYWPVYDMHDFVAQDVFTDPTMPCSYSFMLRNGTYYALAGLFNASSSDMPYAVGAVYNLSLEDLMADGPDATVVDGADVSGRDMILRKIPIVCDVEVTIDYPWHEPVVGDEELTITGTAYSPCSCVDVNDVEIAIYYTDYDDPDTFTYYWNETAGTWQPPTIIYNPVTYVSGGCGTTDPLVWEYTIDDSFFHGGGSYMHYIHVKAKDQEGNEGENLSSFTVGIASEDYVSYWELNGDLTDSIGTNDGTGYGDLAPTAGQVGQGYVFDGDGDWVGIAGTAVTGLSDWTWSGWVYPTMSTVGQHLYTEGFVNGGSFTINVNPGGSLSVTMFNNWVWESTSVSGVIAYDQWNHVVVTLEGGGYLTGTLKIYVNGTLVHTSTDCQMVTMSTHAAIGDNVGAHNPPAGHQPSAYFDGILDDIAVFDRALSGDEILQCYDNGYYGGFGYLGDI